MAIKCPNCSGGMVFDIGKQKLTCPYCNSECSVKEYRLNNAAEYVDDNYSVNVFRCRNCGAELTAPEEQTVAYCAYCGGEAILNQKQAETLRPKRIIPFRKTKEAAVKAYEDAVKKILYVPRELKDPAFLEGFRGIYLPYWNIDVQIPEKELKLDGSRTYTSGGYDYHETYEVRAHVGGQVEGAVYDASAAFDDTLSAQIAPFDQIGDKDFDEAYLAGFYADRVTTSPKIYGTIAREQAAEKVCDSIRRGAGKVSVSLPLSKEKRLALIDPKATGERVSLFPVWFLTWRRGDRVAYSVMNGQSGKMSIDLPVDLGHFFLYSGVAAAILFLLLSLVPAFIQPMTMASMCAILLMLSGRLLNREMQQIRIREQHLYDYGDMSGAKKAKVKSVAAHNVGMALLWIFYALLLLIAYGTSTGSDGTVGPTFLFTLIGQIVISVKLIRNAGGMDHKSGILPALIAPVIMGLGLYMGTAPEKFPNDAWYYGLAMGCLAGILINSLFAIGHYNELATRPVPNFFRREGANNARS